MASNKSMWSIRPNRKDGPRLGVDVESGYDVHERRRDIHLRFCTLDSNGDRDETLLACDLQPEAAREVAAAMVKAAEGY